MLSFLFGYSHLYDVHLHQSSWFSLSVLGHDESNDMHEKKCPVFAFSSAFPPSLAINHNLFAWMLPRRSGSLSTVCPCVPSSVCILYEDYGFVSVAFLLTFMQNRSFLIGLIEQKKFRGKVGHEDRAQRGRIQCCCILWSCNWAGWQ